MNRQVRQVRPYARRRRNLGSTVIFAALAVVLIAIAGYVYFVENDDEEQPTAPPPNPETVGRIEIVNVQDALIAQDLDAVPGRSSARSPQLSPIGQAITLDTETLYAFVYTTVAEREADSEGLDLESITLSALGTPIAGVDGAPFVAVRGNVIVVLPSDDVDLRARVDAAMASLPDVGDTTAAIGDAWIDGSVALA